MTCKREELAKQLYAQEVSNTASYGVDAAQWQGLSPREKGHYLRVASTIITAMAYAEIREEAAWCGECSTEVSGGQCGDHLAQDLTPSA